MKFYSGRKMDQMPINLAPYYDRWKDIRKVYKNEENFDELRKKMIHETFDDSKQLKEEDREEIYKRINDCKELGYLYYQKGVISALEISELMSRDNRVNLNKMSHETVVRLIREILEQGINVTRVFVDTVGPPEKFQNYLADQFKDQSKHFFCLTKEIQFFVRKKADSLFKCVSAASIVAKVTRDRSIKNWIFREKQRNGKPVTTDGIGCGYPSDPKTKAWLRQHLSTSCGLPEIVRFSWKTIFNLFEERNCPVEFKSMYRNMTINEYNNLGFNDNYLVPKDYEKGKYFCNER